METPEIVQRSGSAAKRRKTSQEIFPREKSVEKISICKYKTLPGDWFSKMTRHGCPTVGRIALKNRKAPRVQTKQTETGENNGRDEAFVRSEWICFSWDTRVYR